MAFRTSNNRLNVGLLTYQPIKTIKSSRDIGYSFGNLNVDIFPVVKGKYQIQLRVLNVDYAGYENNNGLTFETYEPQSADVMNKIPFPLDAILCPRHYASKTNISRDNYKSVFDATTKLKISSLSDLENNKKYLITIHPTLRAHCFCSTNQADVEGDLKSNFETILRLNLELVEAQLEGSGGGDESE